MRRDGRQHLIESNVGGIGPVRAALVPATPQSDLGARRWRRWRSSTRSCSPGIPIRKRPRRPSSSPSVPGSRPPCAIVWQCSPPEDCVTLLELRALVDRLPDSATFPVSWLREQLERLGEDPAGPKLPRRATPRERLGGNACGRCHREPGSVCQRWPRRSAGRCPGSTEGRGASRGRLPCPTAGSTGSSCSWLARCGSGSRARDRRRGPVHRPARLTLRLLGGGRVFEEFGEGNIERVGKEFTVSNPMLGSSPDSMRLISD